MLSEGRKRDTAANALLSLSFAANPAQSPKDFVRSGHIESPGVVQMQRTFGDPRKKPKDLNREPVIRRGTKLKEGKTFKEFVEEAYLIEARRFVTRDEAQAKFDKLSPEEREKRDLRNSGANHGGWGTKLKDSLKKQRKRRSQRLKPLTQNELETHAKRNLRKNPNELAAIAADREEDARKKQKAAARRLTKKTGTKHVEDHIQPLQQDKRKPENRERFEKITPSDASSNIQVTSEPKNLRKGSKPPRIGQRGHGTTRSSAIKQRLDKAQKFSNKLDNLVKQIKSER